MTNLYQILGVSSESSQAEIRRSYKRLAMLHHPDRGGDKEKFQQIQNAYDVLSDATRRAHYDATGSAEVELSPEEKKAQAMRAKALQTIRQVFAAALNKQSEATKDLLVTAQEMLASSHEELTGKVEEVRAKANKARRAADRVSDEENLLAPLLQSLASEAATVCAQGEDELAMVDLAVAILGAGTYRVDAPTEEEMNAEMEAVKRQMRERMEAQFFNMFGTSTKRTNFFNPGP